MRRLVAAVYVTAQSGEGFVVFRPGDDVPDWAAAQITNPKAWAGDPEPAPSEGGPGLDPDDVARRIEVRRAAEAQADVPEPPRRGPGSSRKAWADYAASKGVEVPDGASRDDIIAALHP